MCPSSFWGFTKMQFQRNITIASGVGFHILILVKPQQWQHFTWINKLTKYVSVGSVLGSIGFQMQTPGTLCLVCQCMESAHLFLNIRSGTKKILNYMYCPKKKPQKQQGHLLTCNVGANKYWVHVWFSNWLYNVQYCQILYLFLPVW